MKLFRCSSLHKLIGDAQSIASELRNDEINALIRKKKRTDEEEFLIQKLKTMSLSGTAISEIRKIAKEDLTDTRKFKGNVATRKGNLLEGMAIELSGKMRFRKFEKHVGRMNNHLITGECDVLDKSNRMILDTKCSQDIDTHPWFADEALEKVKDAGYDIQMQGYMWLYDCDVANVDFWLLPTPSELLSGWDDLEYLIDSVEKIDIRERLTTVVIERDESIIQKIKDKIPHCQEYYAKLMSERSKGVKAA
ncbi:hypothetical protein [Acinetobacter schindleri]|uniref:hypothetical protein n=1 Tax=Acinetobacter schindleri TaxID=108981 RepID=UPI003BF5F5B0